MHLASITALPHFQNVRHHNMQVTDGQTVLKVSNGDAMMTKITAAGCSVTAIACAFITAAPEDPLRAAAFALAVFGWVSFCTADVVMHVSLSMCRQSCHADMYHGSSVVTIVQCSLATTRLLVQSLSYCMLQLLLADRLNPHLAQCHACCVLR